MLPEHSGIGIGAGLLTAACRRAKEGGARRLVLTTFRDLSFNAPWYARHGFVELAEGMRGPALEAILAAEAEAGLAARCAMAKALP